MSLENRKIIDISPLISEDIAVFPGDTPFSRQELLSFENKDHLDLSTIKTTVHLGAHTDAPSHYHGKGMTMEKRDLERYLGPCQVIDVSHVQGRIKDSDIDIEKITTPRVLFKTLSFPNPNEWTNNFTALSSPLIHALKKKGVLLVGIDTPSVDPSDDKDLQSHKAVFECDMGILEGIVLENVDPGHYELIALPLRIKGCDASPVRAVLIS